MADSTDGFTFSNNWFAVTAKTIWDGLIPTLQPAKFLEVGSFEGASACYLIEHTKRDLELHCIDTWEGGIEHQRAGVDMSAVEARFHDNTTLAVRRSPHPVKIVTHKGRSDDQLAGLLAGGHRDFFDMIYIDGSHYAHDALSDAVLSFPLLKVGGHMFFDDYLWKGNGISPDPLNAPKLGVDAFMNVFYHKMRLILSPNAQVVARKIAA